MIFSFLSPVLSNSRQIGVFSSQFLENSSQIPCTFRFLSLPLPSLQFTMWSIPHEQRARRYVQAQPTFSKRCGLIFLPITCRIDTRVIRPLFMWSIPHGVEMPETEYGGSPSTCFLPFVVDSMVSCSRRGSASRFFRTPTSTRAGRIPAIRLQLTYIMQTSAFIQRTAHLRPFSISTASIKAWLNGKSKFYTTICEFEVTRREVLRVHAALLSLGAGAVSAESSFLAALCCVVLSGHNVYKLNQEEKGGEA